VTKINVFFRRREWEEKDFANVGSIVYNKIKLLYAMGKAFLYRGNSGLEETVIKRLKEILG